MQDFKVYFGSEGANLWKGAVKVLCIATGHVIQAFQYVDWDIKVTNCESFEEEHETGFKIHMEAESKAHIKLALKTFLDYYVRIRSKRSDLEANIMWDNEIDAFV